MGKEQKAKASSRVEPEGSGSVPSEVVERESSETIAHAYALVPVPGKIGKYRAVHLTNVIAESQECLEPSGRAEPGAQGLARCESAMLRRYMKGGW